MTALEQQGWHIEALRSFAEPAADLERALKAARRSGKPALVVVDQFEEFVILEGRAASEGGRAFIARLKELRQKPIPKLAVLLALRSDYLNAIVELDLDDLDFGQNWREIDPFKRAAARLFLSGAPAGSAADLVERMLDGLDEILEEVPGLYRLVTLNMLGLVLEGHDRQMTRRPGRLIGDDPDAALKQKEIAPIVSRVLGPLITQVWNEEAADSARHRGHGRDQRARDPPLPRPPRRQGARPPARRDAAGVEDRA